MPCQKLRIRGEISVRGVNAERSNISLFFSRCDPCRRRHYLLEYTFAFFSGRVFMISAR